MYLNEKREDGVVENVQVIRVKARVHHEGARTLQLYITRSVLHVRAVGRRVQRYSDEFSQNFAQLL